jgi:hypothetical protein
LVIGPLTRTGVQANLRSGVGVGGASPLLSLAPQLSQDLTQVPVEVGGVFEVWVADEIVLDALHDLVFEMLLLGVGSPWPDHLRLGLRRGLNGSVIALDMVLGRL